MLDQDNGLTAAIPAAENGEVPSQDWFEAHRTTPEQLENTRWVEGRNRDMEIRGALKQTMGLEYEVYRSQIESLSSEERSDLEGKSPEEIADHLEEMAEAEREHEKRKESFEQRAKEQAEANFAPVETPQLREVRRAMKTAYQAAASLDDRIAELQRLNDLRDDLTAKGWESLPAEKWVAAREGKFENYGPEISNLIQEKQSRLQEAALHQSAYHEGIRAIQPPPGPALNTPIGQIIGQDGQPVPISRADIATIVQIERDDQAHHQRVVEATKIYPDWEHVARNSVGLPLDDGQAAFIRSLPNSADVVYYLATHHDETIALSRMPSYEATRALINISHKTARPNASSARKVTQAPPPPKPVTGGSSRGFDVNDESMSNDDWMRKRNADLQRRGKSY